MWFARGIGKIPDVSKPPLNKVRGRLFASRLRDHARRTGRSRRGGAYLIEFSSVVTFAVIPILLSGVEMAWHGAVSAAVDNAALRASRFGSLGRQLPDGTHAGAACQDAIEREARRAGGGLLSGPLRVTVESYPTMAQASARLNAARNPGLGGYTVNYRVEYDQRFVFLKALFGKHRTHVATTTIQNEPFPDGAPNAPPC